MNLTVEQLISYLQTAGFILAIPAIIFLMVAIALGITSSPRKLKKRIKELTTAELPPLIHMPPIPEPPAVLLDLSDMKRVIRAYVPYEEMQELARLFDKAEVPTPEGWESSPAAKGALTNA